MMLLTLLASIALLLAASDTAHAGFLIAPVVALVGLTGAAATIATAVIGVALSVGISYVASKLLAKTPDAPDATSVQSVGGIQLDLRVDPDIPQSLIVGRAVTAGSLAYANTFGKRGDIDNSDMIEVIALADHPCEKLHSAFVEGVECILRDSGSDRGMLVDGYTGAVDKVTLDQFQAAFGQSLFGGALAGAFYNQLDAQNDLKKYGDLLALRFFDGRQTTADNFTVANLGAAQRPWTQNHVGTGITYVRTHSIYERERVPGRLAWKFVVDGIRLYDPRKDSTVPGGDGPHRFDDLSTHEWTDNLAVIAYNVCRGIYVADAAGNRQFFYGLENTSAEQLPLDVWFAAMNEADVLVERGDGDFEKQFCGGAEISIDTEPREMIQGLLRACGGRFVEIGGIYKLYLGAPGLPVLSITDDAIVANREEQYRPVLGLEQRVNYLTGTYTSPDDGWITKVAPPRENLAWRAEDRRRLPADLTAPMVQSDTQMQRLMLQLLNRARRQRKHVLTLPPSAMVLEPGDGFAWGSARNGYVDKLFEIDSVDYEPNLNVTVSCTEVDPNDYDWSSDDELPVVDGRLVTLLPAAKVITGFQAEGFIWKGDLGQTLPAIKLTWDPPEDDDVHAVRWQIRLAADPTDNTSGLTDRDDVTAGQIVIAAGLQSVTQYQVRARFESWNGYTTEWSLWILVTMPDGRTTFDLAKAVSEEFRRVNEAVARVEEAIATVARQDAANWTDKLESRRLLSVVRGALSAAVEHIEAVQANDREAFASYQTTVEARFGDTAASIMQTSEAIAGIDGKLAAQYTIEVAADTNVASLKGYADGETAGWVFNGNFLQITFPGIEGGDPQSVFQIANVNGAARIVFRGDMFGDGMIRAQAIDADSLSAINANIGEVTAGRMVSPDELFEINLSERYLLVWGP
ncbi:MAG TPA: phage tail protein [Pseudolabrys sp.]|nr:phage tail protein [Pseudolabrys sp.]